MNTKRCTVCLLDLPIEMFHRGGKKGCDSYRRPRCKECETTKRGLCICGQPKAKASYRCSSCRLASQRDPKQCNGCMKFFPLSEYSWRPDGRGGQKRRSRCKSCECAAAKRHRKNNPDRAKQTKKVWNAANKEKVRRSTKRAVWRRKGFDPDEIERAIASAGGKCRICGLAVPQVKLCMDHCHSINKFRGIICTRCNSGLGLFVDNVDSLRRAIIYLEEFETKQKS